MRSRLWWMTCWAKWLPRTISWKIESSPGMDQKSVYPKIFIFPQQRKLNGVFSPELAPVCTGAGAGSGSTRFRRRFQEALVQSQVRFNRGSGEGSGEGRGGFCAEPGQVQQGSGEGSIREALVQSQVRPNRAPEKVSEKAWEALVQSQVRFNRICVHLI